MVSGIITVFIVSAILVFLYLFPVTLWFNTVMSGTPVNPFFLIGMRLRGVDAGMIIDAYIQARKSGLDIDIADMEAHYLCGGDILNVVRALISAQKASLKLDFERAAAIDLAGRDVHEAVRMCVSPKTINTPPVSAVAKNGIQVRVSAKVTVKANIDKLVGGAGEDTIIARVGEGICTAVGSADTHYVVQEQPEKISQQIIAKGLDSGTAFTILSVDISDIDIGKNIGSILQIEQAEANKKVAQAKAEERKAEAIAKSEEMRALREEMKAQIIESEAEVPLALATAIKSGKIR
jgi:uncharacterized protein YqfA (UPF0365 family)